MNKISQTKTHPNKVVTASVFLLFSLLYALSLFAFVPLQELCRTFSNSDAFDFFALFALPVALIVLEHIISFKSEIPLKVFAFTPLLAAVGILLAFLISKKVMNSYMIEDMTMYVLIIGGLKFVVGIIDLLWTKKFRTIPLLVAGFVFYCGIFIGSTVFYHEKVISNGGNDLTSESTSWSSINQMINRDESWQKIVTDTEFTLGEITEKLNDYGEKGYYCERGSFPNIDGSTVCVPMAVEFARQHLNFNDEQSRDITNFSTSHWAYMNLVHRNHLGTVGFPYKDSFLNVPLDPIDIVIATHPSEEELKTAEEKGVELVLEPVCYDAFVFITHKDNPVESLTVQQIKDIYSGKIKNWKDVGGKNEKIRAFQREPNSGSQTAMERLVMDGTNMIDPIEIVVVEGMGQLVEAVAEYENETASIGYTYRYYIDNLYKNDEIKTIAIEGIAPTDENIRSGAYPYTTNYYGVIRKEDENNVGGKFLRWMLSNEGQKCISQAGYIAISSD